MGRTVFRRAAAAGAWTDTGRGSTGPGLDRVPVDARLTGSVRTRRTRCVNRPLGARPNQVGPWRLESAIRAARSKVEDLPGGFRFHDLRHYLASLLVASGADVKKVQARLRHASAKTTLDMYGHLWPDADESTRTALEAVFESRPEQARNR